MLSCALLGSMVLASPLHIYPNKGGLNLRVPVVRPVAGGAKGKAIPFEKVSFSYRLSPHLSFHGRGQCEFWLRDNLRRETKQIVILSNGQGTQLRLSISDAPSGRVPRLQVVVNGKVKEQALLKMGFGKEWTQTSLVWEEGKAWLETKGQKTEPVRFAKDFAPEQLTCLAWSVDELTLQGSNGTFALTWEQDYSGILTVTSEGGVAGHVMGFDTFVVGSDKSKRDCPVVQLVNSTATNQKVVLDFAISAETSQIKRHWQRTISLPALSEIVHVIAPPFPLKSDIYHLKITSRGLDHELSTNKHFIYVERRREPAGTPKFGLHDCDVRDFGFWPDALPITIAHKYLRWGYVQGPAWVKNSDGTYGIDPALPPEQWNWNTFLDWELLSGRDLYVSIHSEPLSTWQRARDYPGKMKTLSWGTRGGFPKLDLYSRFVRAAAKRYKGRISMWEVENEPSSHLREYPDDYVKIAKTVHDAFKAEDPSASIYGICGTSTFVPWMKQVFKGGGAQYFDAISWHTYTTPNQPDDANLGDMLADANKSIPAGMPVLNSETGVLPARRNQVDRPLAPEYVAAKIKDADPAFVSRGAWPGAVTDEWQSSASLVKNAIINFLAGSRAFVFFGWNPRWPSKPVWGGQRPNFSVLTSSAEGERTPSLVTLAIGVLTAQFEGVSLDTSYHPVTAAGVNGGIFTKSADGSVACLWARTPRGTALIASGQSELELVDTFGSTRVIKPVSPKNTEQEYVYSIDLNQMPVYLHSQQNDLKVIPSPIEKMVAGNSSADSGTVTFTLINRNKTPRELEIAPSASTGLSLQPKRFVCSLAPGSRKNVTFTFKVNDPKKGNEFWVPFTVTLPGGYRYEYSANITMKPTTVVAAGPASWRKADLKAMQQVCRELTLDRVEQVVVGRPPKTASLQEAHFWGGKEELSAKAYVGYNDTYLFLCLKVHDAFPRLPARWPDVRGSSVELFVDLRSSDKGLGSSRYGDHVYQFVIRPSVQPGEVQKIWCPQADDIEQSGVVLSGGYLSPTSYWTGVAIPWRLTGLDKPPATIGFDFGVNGSWPDKKGRKSQLMLFGTATNSRDASAFGSAHLQ
jgi:hypothetical protein